MLKWHNVNTMCALNICPQTQGLCISLLLYLFFLTYVLLWKPAQRTSLWKVTPLWVSFEVTCLRCCSQTTNTQHRWSLRTDVIESKNRANWVLNVAVSVWLWKYTAVADYLIFVMYEATGSVWQKCLKSICNLIKLEVFFEAHAISRYLCLILLFECGVMSKWYRL